MATESIQSTLRAHPFLAGLQAGHLALLASCATDRIFAAGDFICRVGTPADSFFLVREGRASLEVHVPLQPGLRLETIHPGEVLGWSWLLSPYRWHLDGRALEPVRALEIDGRVVRRECERDHEFGYQMLKRFAPLLGHRLQSARVRLGSHVT